MRNQSFQIDRKTARQMRVELFKKIYIQEFLLNYRPEVIIAAISDKFIIPAQTIRDYIKPASIRREIAEGKYEKDENYQSIIS